NLPKVFISCLYLLPMSLIAQQPINYDESLEPAYELPALLKPSQGKLRQTKKESERIRRPELLEIFSEQMYGRTSIEDIPVTYELLRENRQALGGKATMRQVKMRFSKNGRTVDALLLLMLPNHLKKDIPMFIGYNY